jgi:hypothetical protein
VVWKALNRPIFQTGSKLRALVWPFVLAVCGFALTPAAETGQNILAEDIASVQAILVLAAVALAIFALQFVTLAGILRRLGPPGKAAWTAANWFWGIFGFVLLPAGALRFGQEFYDVLFIANQPLSGIWLDTIWFGAAALLWWNKVMQPDKL